MKNKTILTFISRIFPGMVCLLMLMNTRNARRLLLPCTLLATLAGAPACEPEDTRMPSSGSCAMDTVPMSRYPVDMILVVDRSVED